MKKIYTLALAGMMATGAMAEVFIVEKTNGDKIEFNVDDIKEMRFKDKDVETGNLAPDHVKIVDLGLSVCWASCNVGANAPEANGDYVQWGAVKPINWYSWSYYPWGNQQNISKYNVNDGLVYLQTEDDYASQKWGTDWRMPSQEEANELLDSVNCKIEVFAVENGVQGIKIISKKIGYEGRYIFIPFNGYRQDSQLFYTGNVYLWTNTVGRGFYPFAMAISVLGEGDVEGNFSGSTIVSGLYRYIGMNIRPVYTKEYTGDTPGGGDEKPGDTNVVDMGVSVLWSTYNAGAESPEQIGTYVAWGETKAKENYGTSSYKFGSSYTSYTKYSKANKISVLEPEDDAATAIMGEEWRTPTSQEWSELLDACECATGELNGVNGIRLTSKVEGYEGNSIFIPMCGYKQDGGEINAASEINLWSSTVTGTALMTQKTAISFKYTSFPSNASTANLDRVYGCPVRGVKAKSAK